MSAWFTVQRSCARIGYVADGTSCVMKTTVTSSTGSTQNAVDAAPPHRYSPREAGERLSADDFKRACNVVGPRAVHPTRAGLKGERQGREKLAVLLEGLVDPE